MPAHDSSDPRDWPPNAQIAIQTLTARAEAAEQRAEYRQRVIDNAAAKLARVREWAEDQEHLIAAQVLDILDGERRTNEGAEKYAKALSPRRRTWKVDESAPWWPGDGEDE